MEVRSSLHDDKTQNGTSQRTKNETIIVLIFSCIFESILNPSMLMNNLYKTTLRPAGFLLLTSVSSFGTYSLSQNLPKMTPKSLTTNPLLDHSGLPRFNDITPQHVKSAIEENLESLKGDFANLVRDL